MKLYRIKRDCTVPLRFNYGVLTLNKNDIIEVINESRYYDVRIKLKNKENNFQWVKIDILNISEELTFVDIWELKRNCLIVG